MVDTKSRSRSPQRSPASETRRKRSRSRSPRCNGPDTKDNDSRRSRSRSRSPRREPPKKKDDFGKAFKWKSKDKSGKDGDRDEREYRQRDGDNYRPRRYGGRDDRTRNNDRVRDTASRDGADSKVSNKFGGSNANVKDKFGNSNSKDGMAPPPKDKSKPKPAAVAAAPVTYILVTVNDRLGTKATIPCMPNDTVGDFKKMVAAHIGRQPHEIMLKRQGERPFKDFITLGDYGVSSGVQLDLELDTGD
jgi:hypothetical protein